MLKSLDLQKDRQLRPMNSTWRTITVYQHWDSRHIPGSGSYGNAPDIITSILLHIGGYHFLYTPRTCFLKYTGRQGENQVFPREYIREISGYFPWFIQDYITVIMFLYQVMRVLWQCEKLYFDYLITQCDTFISKFTVPINPNVWRYLGVNMRIMAASQSDWMKGLSVLLICFMVCIISVMYMYIYIYILTN